MFYVCLNVFHMIEEKSLALVDDMTNSIFWVKCYNLSGLHTRRENQIVVKQMLKYLTENPTFKEGLTYEIWMSEDSIVMGWLWHCMEIKLLL